MLDSYHSLDIRLLFLLQESSGILSVQRPTRINPVSRITKQPASHPSIYPSSCTGNKGRAFKKAFPLMDTSLRNDKKWYFIAANLFAQRTLRAICARGRQTRGRDFSQFNYIIITVHRMLCCWCLCAVFMGLVFKWAELRFNWSVWHTGMHAELSPSPALLATGTGKQNNRHINSLTDTAILVRKIVSRSPIPGRLGGGAAGWQ